MRHSYSSPASESSGFSTIFGDLVFGLLFVFFLLAIALVFNRPNDGAFASEIKTLEKDLARELKALEAVRKKHKALQALLAQVQKGNEDKDRRIADLDKRRKEKEKQIDLRIEKITKNIEVLKKAVENWSKKKADLETAIRNPAMAATLNFGGMLKHRCT